MSYKLLALDNADKTIINWTYSNQKELANKLKSLINNLDIDYLEISELVPALETAKKVSRPWLLYNHGAVTEYTNYYTISNYLLNVWKKFKYQRKIDVFGYIYIGGYRVYDYIIDFEYGINDYIILYDIDTSRIHKCKIYSSDKGTYINIYKSRVYSDNWLRLNY